MKTIITLCAVAVFAVVGLTSMVPSNGGATIINNNFIVPFPHNVNHPCTGEIIAMDGNAHVNVHGVVTPNGNVTMTHTQNFQGISGVSDAGNTYQCVSAIVQVMTGAVGETFTFSGSQSLVGHGPGTVNLLNNITYHYTVNANGDLTVEHQTGTFTCN